MFILAQFKTNSANFFFWCHYTWTVDCLLNVCVSYLLVDGLYCDHFEFSNNCIFFNPVLRHIAECVLGHCCGQFSQCTRIDQGKVLLSFT